MGSPRRFELVDGKSSKFWQVQLDDKELTVSFGRIGTSGQTQTKAFDTEAKAKAEYDKLVAEKAKKGYSEVGDADPRAAVEPKVSKADGARNAAESSPATSKVYSAQTSAAVADEDRIHWNDALAARVFARRGGHVSKSRVPGEAAHWWKQLRIHSVQQLEAFKLAIRLKYVGYQHLEPVVARLENETPEEGSNEQDVCLFAFAAFKESGPRPYRSRSELEDCVAHLLVAQRGLAHATRALITALDYEYCSGGMLFQRKSNGWWWKDSGSLRALSCMRELLANASDVDHAAARDAAATLRESGSPWQRAACVFLFPSERGWYAEEKANIKRYSLMLASAQTAADLDDLGIGSAALYPGEYQRPIGGDVAATLLDGAGLAAARFLVQCEIGPHDGAHIRRLRAATLAAIGDDASIVQLASELYDKEAVAALAAAVNTQPRRLMRILAPRAAERGKSGEPARSLVTQLMRRSPEVFNALLPSFPPDVRRTLEALVEAEGAETGDAAKVDVPAVLRAPPWLQKKKPAAHAERAVAPEPLAASVAWKPGERETLRNANVWVDKDRLAWEALAEGTDSVSLADLALVPIDLAPKLLSRVTQSPNVYDNNANAYQRIAERLELLALPLLTEGMSIAPGEAIGAVAAFAATELAPRMAEVFSTKKSLRTSARTWLLRHPEHAATGLLNDALGPVSGKRHKYADAALRLLASNGRETVVKSVASRAGVEVEITRMLARDPLTILPAKMPKRPDYLVGSELPRVVLKEEKGALPVESTEHILTMLAISTFDEPYGGLQELREVCTATSLARLAWAVFDTWNTNGAPSTDGWCLQAVGHFGSDESARKLAALIRSWPGEGAQQRAVLGLDALAAIGSDVALMHLNRIALTVTTKGLQAKASQKIEQIAEARGLSRAELEDRLAPDLGLDDHGSLALDFGPRQFRVGFDEALRPFVKDTKGERLKELPKPNKSDDEELSKAAVELWSQLKKDAKTAATLQIMRLEMAMCGQRRFSAKDFVELFVNHPLVFHIVRRLIWATYDSANVPRDTFRVAEDRSFADVSDQAWQLPDDATVGIPHPFELDTAVSSAWSTVLADYEIPQPFQQLDRPTYPLFDDERDATELERVVTLELPTGKVLGLQKRGWRRGPALDAGVVRWMEKPLPNGKIVCLALDPGLHTGSLYEEPEQTLGKLTIVAHSADAWGRAKGDTFGTLEPIVFSELVRDLLWLEGMQ